MINNNDKSKDDLNPKCEKIKQIPGSNNGLPVCLISDFEGRPDILILFLIRTGVVKDMKFLNNYEKFLKDKQPKDYIEDDFVMLSKAVTDLCALLQNPNKESINTSHCILQFLGDYFGNRSLAGRTSQEKQKMAKAGSKDDKSNEVKNLIVNGEEKKEEKKIIVRVGSSDDELPKGKHLMVNGVENDGRYASRSNIILCGTGAENVQNYNRTIDCNRYVSDIMLELIKLRNVEPYVSGNHEAYGSNVYLLGTGNEVDRFICQATDSPNNPCVYGKYCYDGSSQTYDDLDVIKNNFIYQLKQKNKPLQLFNCMQIGDKNFIFKHTNFATEGQLWEMSKTSRKSQNIEFLPCTSYETIRYKGHLIASLAVREEMKLKIELTGDKGTDDKDRKEYNFKDITTLNIEDGYNCFVCFGHTGKASKNDIYIEKNCLCVDCNFYAQDDKDKCEQKCNFFRISADCDKIEEINLYTGQVKKIFNTFQKTKQRKQEMQQQEKKIKEEMEEKEKNENKIKDLEKENEGLKVAANQMNAQLFEQNNKHQNEQNKLNKIRNYIEYNKEIQAETIDAGSIIGYLNDKDVFKNRGNAFTRQIGFDRRRKARFNALCEVLEEKIRDKTKDNTFTFGDNLDNITEDKINRIKELFEENGNNQHNEANQEVIYNVRNNINNEGNNLNNTQTIHLIKQEIANRLNQVGCCC